MPFRGVLRRDRAVSLSAVSREANVCRKVVYMNGLVIVTLPKYPAFALLDVARSPRCVEMM
jgi:hypothetical protein